MGVALLIASLVSLVASSRSLAEARDVLLESEVPVVRRLLEEGWYEKAEARAQALLVRAEATSGSPALQALDILDLLVESRWRQGKVHGETRALAERLLRGRSRARGAGDSTTARAWNHLANVLGQLGNIDEARAAFDTALAIRERVLPADHPDLAWTLNDLAGLLMAHGELEAARPLMERVRDLRLRALGPDHPLVAWSFSGLAYLEMLEGDYPAARRGFEHVLSIRERVLPPDHPDIAHALTYLATLDQGLGDLDRARASCERGLAIRERALGANSADAAKSLATLASILRNQGDYGRARDCAERSLRIREAVFGKDHPEVATSLASLASQMMSTGDLSDAGPLLDRARAIRAAAFGARSPNVAVVVERQSELALSRGDRARARVLAEEAVAIKRDALGPDHAALAVALLRLGAACTALDEHESAMRAYDEALRIGQRAWGPESWEVGHASRLLAEVLLRRGELEPAGSAAERALRIARRMLGSRNPEVASGLGTRAAILAVRGEADAALDAALEAEEIGREHLRTTIRALPERIALGYESVRAGGLDLALCVAIEEGRPGLSRRAADALVRSRALVLDEMLLRARASPHSSPDSQMARAARRLFALRSQLAQLAVAGFESGLGASYRTVIDSVRRECERAESDLAALSTPFRDDQERARIGLERVLQALPEDAALVGFVRFRDAAGARGVAGEARYAALVARGRNADPVLVPCGSAARVDSLVGALRVHLDDPAGDTSVEAAYRRTGDALRRAVWDPITARVGDVSRVFVVPDGALSAINLAALPAPASATRYLVEARPVIHLLCAERDLVREAPRHASAGLLAIGGVDFGDPHPVDSRGPRERRPALRGGATGGDCDSLRFDPLPASDREVQEVLELWRRHMRSPTPAKEPCFELRGHAATKQAFSRLARGRRIIHVATHGFLLDEDCARRPSAGGRAGDDDGIGFQISGLALSGANRPPQATGAREGLLTSGEIPALDLAGTEWVVLSACRSGVGEFVRGEGVLGMRRAFHTSGVGSVIMSLWRVDDAATRRWMRALYRARWEQRMSTADCVRAASLEFLRTQRLRGESTHPRLWGAFVAEGDWR